MLALVFQGQGTQRVGMGRWLSHAGPAAAAAHTDVSRAAGEDLAARCRKGPTAVLDRTEVAQPAVVACGLAALAACNEAGIEPDVVAGHSVGELTALVAAGALDRADAAHAVVARGQAMAAVPGEGTMAAVLGLDVATVAAICTETSPDGRLVVAIDNGGSNQVISGARPAVGRATAAARAAGASHVVELRVSHAFHSPLMAPAVPSWARIVADLPISEPRCPIVLGTSGEVTTSADEIRGALVEQLVAPIAWGAVLRRLARDATTIAEVGDRRIVTRPYSHGPDAVPVQLVDGPAAVRSLAERSIRSRT